MTVLVTGGAGYIGSHMVLALCDAGEETLVVDNLSTGHDWAVDGRASFVQADVGDQDIMTRLIKEHGVKSIVHFAGSIVVPESVTNPLKYYGNNTVTSRNLIAAAVESGVENFVFSSTAAVYGMTGLDPVFEDVPLNPLSPYGRSKLMTEMMLADTAAAHPIKYGILRYFNVAGADTGKRSGQSSEMATHLIKVAAEAATGKRTEMSIFGEDYETPDGTCIRDYVHVSDLVSAHMLLLKHLRNGGESTTLNCGYGRGFSVREVIEQVKLTTGTDFQVNMASRRAGDPPAIVAGAKRIRDMGWTPEHESLETIVETAVAWEKHLQTRNR
jgi:UDP-glucose 4-epimerase